MVANAEAMLRVALSRSGSMSADVLLAHGERSLAAGDMAAATSMFEQLIAHEPRWAGGPCGEIRTLADRAAGGHWSIACTFVTLARPPMVAGHARLAATHVAAGRNALCVTAARKAIELNTHDVFSRFQLGVCLKDLDMVSGAFEALDAVRQVHPEMAGLRRFKQWMSSVESNRATRRTD